MLLSRLVRVDRPAEAVAANFAAFCKSKAIITRGLVRVGTTPRRLRGLIAAKDIGAMESIVTVPHVAMLSPMDAARDTSFCSIFTPDTHCVRPRTLNEKLQGSFVRRSYVGLGLYLCHVILTNDVSQHEFLKYIDFLPRGESPFTRLSITLTSLIENDQPTLDAIAGVAAKHHVEAREVKEMLLWTLAMVFSRSLAMEHAPTTARLAVGTPFAEPMPEGCGALQLPVMVPLIDMCNHSSTEENAALMVPQEELQELRCVVLRSLRPIRKGEEIVTKYGRNDPQELEIIYGVEPGL